MTFPVFTSIPAHFIPESCFAFNSVKISIGSKPAFSARVLGTTSIESANAKTANCSRPDKVLAKLLSPRASSISVAPAPATTLLRFNEATKQLNESTIALSISSTTCSVPPLIRIVTAFGFWHCFT